MARPIKVHEDTLFRVMTKSLKPIETHLSGIHKSLAKQSVEDRIEGKRAEKLMRDNELRQTKLLEHIDKVLSATKPKSTGETIKDSKSSGLLSKASIAAIAAAVWAALPDRYTNDPERGAGAFAGMQLWWKNMKKSMKDWKSPKSFSDVWLKFTTKWDAWITQIKESKVVTKMSETWKNFKKDFVKPFTSAFTLKEGSKIKTFVTWLGGLPKAALGIGGWLLKWFKPLYYVYAIWEAAWAGKGAADNIEVKDPEAGMFKKTIKVQGAIADKLFEILFDKMIVGLAGDTVQFIFEKIFPTAWVYDKDGNVKVFGKQYKFGEDWNLGARFTKWRHGLMEEFGKALDDFWNNFTWNPDKWAKDFDAWMEKTLTDFANDIFGWFTRIVNAIRNTKFKNQVTNQVPANPGEVPGAPKPSTDKRPTHEQMKAGHPMNEEKKSVLDKIIDLPMTGWDAGRKVLEGMLKSKETDSSARSPFSKMFDLTSGTKTIRAENATMAGMKWNDMSPYGRKGIEYIIRKIYEKHGGPEPVFTSGVRGPGHPLYSEGSKHSNGYAFDLRSNNLGDKKAAIQADLLDVFSKRNGWFSQFEPAQFFNARTGTKATGEHFHFQKAAQGFFGTVKQPTVFLTGEEGPEHVAIFPNNDPNTRMNRMNQLQSERAMSQGTPPITVISNDNSVNSSGSSSPWIITGAPIRKQVNA